MVGQIKMLEMCFSSRVPDFSLSKKEDMHYLKVGKEVTPSLVIKDQDFTVLWDANQIIRKKQPEI